MDKNYLRARDSNWRPAALGALGFVTVVVAGGVAGILVPFPRVVLVGAFLALILGVLAGLTLERGRPARSRTTYPSWAGLWWALWAAFGGLLLSGVGAIAGWLVAITFGLSTYPESLSYLFPSEAGDWGAAGAYVGGFLGVTLGAAAGGVLALSSSRSWFFAPLGGALLLAIPGAIIGGSTVGPPDGSDLRTAAAMGAIVGALLGALVGAWWALRRTGLASRGGQP